MKFNDSLKYLKLKIKLPNLKCQKNVDTFFLNNFKKLKIIKEYILSKFSTNKKSKEPLTSENISMESLISENIKATKVNNKILPSL